MAATIHTLPNNRNLSNDAIWLTLATDLWADDHAYWELIPTGTNSAGQTMTLTWAGRSLTFTLANTPDGSGLQLPVNSGGSMATYANLFADHLRQNEILTNDFTVRVGGTNTIFVEAISAGALDLDRTENINNFNIQVYDSAGVFSEENLRALVKVYTQTFDANTMELLATFHAPYDASTGLATFDVHSAFCHLKPHLPSTASITSFAYGEASDAYVAWTFRFADKYGTPAVSEAMILANEYTFRTFHGATAADAEVSWRNEVRRHMVRRRDGGTFRKPIGDRQPDWAYWLNIQNGSREIRVEQWLQDGTQPANITHSLGTVTSNTLIWTSCGPQQLGIDVWADPDNPTVRYRVSLMNASNGANLGSLWFDLMPNCEDWGLYLLFDNGVTGCETIWLKGKKTEGYDASAELYQRPRSTDWTPDQGEIFKLNPQGQPTWECSTGYFDDDAYLVALRQLPLSTAAWLVDVENDRFLRVNVEAKRIESVTQDDQDLFFMNITLRAAWTDQASNL